MESYTENLVKYIKKNLGKGYSLESLKWALVKQGYSRSEINKAVDKVEKQFPEYIFSAQETKHRKKEKPIIRYQVITDDNIEQPVKPIFKRSFWSRIKGWFS